MLQTLAEPPPGSRTLSVTTPYRGSRKEEKQCLGANHGNTIGVPGTRRLRSHSCAGALLEKLLDLITGLILASTGVE